MNTFFRILNTLMLSGILCVLIITYQRLGKPIEIENARSALDVNVQSGAVQVEPGSAPIPVVIDRGY